MKKLKLLQQKIAEGGDARGEILQFLQMLHLVLDTIPQRIFWKDVNHVYMGCNNQFAIDAGLASPEDVIGKTDYEMPWQKSADRFRGYDREVMQNITAKVRYEQIMPNAAGENIIVRVNKVPLVDRRGNVIGVLGSYEDITKHKKMEMELLIAEERRQAEEQIRKLSTALEHSPVSVLITDSQGRIEYVNRKFTSISGYGATELIGQKPNVLKSGKQNDAFYKNMWETLYRGQEWSGVFCNKKKNGEIYWESANISPLKDSEGKITHFIGIKEDVTEKRRAEEALQESERKFRAIYEGSNDAILLISANKIFDCNPHAVEMFGYSSKEDVIGLDIIDLSPSIQPNGKEAAELAAEVKKTALKEGFCRFEWVHFCKNGTIVPVDVSLTPLKWEDRMVLLAVVRDMTRQRLAEAELQQQKEMIEESYERLMELEKLRDSLIHMIVHDLRSPLTGVKLTFDLLKLNESADANMMHTLEMGQRSVSDVLSMVADLLDVSRMESGQMPLSKSIQDIVPVMLSVVDSFPQATFQRDLKLEAPPVLLSCFDVDIIRRVVANLVGNAGKFTPRNGHIEIIVEELENGVKISVKDDGCGIPPEFHEKIFEKFGQAESKKKKFGTGLGLTFCKLAVEAHGGSVGLESEVGKGSVFWFTLPSVREG